MGFTLFFSLAFDAGEAAAAGSRVEVSGFGDGVGLVDCALGDGWMDCGVTRLGGGLRGCNSVERWWSWGVSFGKRWRVTVLTSCFGGGWSVRGQEAGRLLNSQPGRLRYGVCIGFRFNVRNRHFFVNFGSGTGVLLMRFARARCRCHYFGFLGAVVFVVFEADAAAPIIGVLQAAEFAVEGFQPGPAFCRIFYLLQGSHGLADFKDEVTAHGFVGVAAAVVLFEFFFVFGEVFEPIDALLVQEPILIAGAAPFGEVLVGDGVAFEALGEDFLGLREVVEPRQDVAAEMAVVEALVQFVADGGGEAGDFANSSCHKIFGFYFDYKT